jgi:predicted Zn-dependent peptidase
MMWIRSLLVTLVLISVSWSETRATISPEVSVPPGFQALEEINLANGLRVLAGKPRRAALFSEVLLVVRAGTGVTGTGQDEAARIAAAAFLSGRRSTDALPIRIELAYLGVTSDFTVGREVTVFRFAIPTANTVAFLHLLADLANRSLLPATVWQDAITQRIQELAREEADSWQQATSLLDTLLWTNAPEGRKNRPASALLTPAMLNSKSSQAFWDRFYVPGNMVLSMWGELPIEEVKQLVGHEFNRLPAEHKLDSPPVPLPEPALTKGGEVRCLRDAGAVPAALLVGVGADVNSDRAFYAWQLAVHILGASSNSRLQRRLRTESQVVYTVEAAGVPIGSRGLTLRIACQTDQVDTTRKFIMAELQRLVKEPPTQQELDLARSLLRSRLKLDSASFRDQFYRRSLAMLSAERVRDPSGAEAIVAAFTPASLLEVLRTTLKPEQASTVVVSTHTEAICNNEKTAN